MEGNRTALYTLLLLLAIRCEIYEAIGYRDTSTLESGLKCPTPVGGSPSPTKCGDAIRFSTYEHESLQKEVVNICCSQNRE